MLEIILFLVALAGSTLAAYSDLKTTEIPDEIPYVMMAVGIVGNLIKSYLVWDYWPFLSSVIVGLGFLGFGFIMYFLGQWGGGDAKILSGMGFLLPVVPPQINIENMFFPFPLSFFFNVFLVGSVYMILYALVISIINRKIWRVFFNDIKAKARIIITLNSLLVLALFAAGFFLVRNNFFLISDFMKLGIVIIAVWLGFFIMWKFVKIVEEVGFKKRIPISELKVGDVPVDYKIWEGITEKELNKIKKSGKKWIWIKEGVRFAPAFPLALIFTLVIGDGIIWLINYVSLF